MIPIITAFVTHTKKFLSGIIGIESEMMHVINIQDRDISMWIIQVLSDPGTISLDKYEEYCIVLNKVADNVPNATPIKPNELTQIIEMLKFNPASTNAPILVCLK